MKVGDISLPDNLYYTKEHEWIFIERSGLVRIGITDYAQKRLHDIVFVELPRLDFNIKRMDSIGTAESVKAVSEIYSPISGQVIERNEELVLNPELINHDPYGGGWIALIKPSDLKSERKKLMKPEEYAKYLENFLE